MANNATIRMWWELLIKQNNMSKYELSWTDPELGEVSETFKDKEVAQGKAELLKEQGMSSTLSETDEDGRTGR